MNQNYKQLNNQILIGVSPNPTEILTNSKIKLYCSKNSTVMTPINFNVEWKRVAIGLEQIILIHENSVYECSPLDLGYFIEAKIKIEDEGISTDQIRKFGPVKLQTQLANLIQKSVTAEPIRAKIIVQKFNTEIVIKLNQTGLSIISKENLEYNMKVDAITDIQLKLDTKIISLKLKQYSETFVKYISVLAKYPLKIQIEAVDMIFESRSKRDYFILMIKKLLYRKTITSSSHISREDSYIKGRQTYLSNNHHLISRSRLSSQPNELSKSRKKIEKKETKKKNEENDIIKDLESKQIFSEFTQKKQDALDLRDSFNQMQQKCLKDKIQMQSDLSIQQIKIQLKEARKTISKLIQQIQMIKDQNMILKQNSSNVQNANLGKEIMGLKQKIQYLSAQNQRLQTEKTQIIAEKIAIQIKYQKQKQQKEFLKQKIIPLNNLNNIPRIESLKKLQFKSPVTKSIHPMTSSMPQSSKQLSMDYSKSMNDLKQVPSDLSPDNTKSSLRPVFKRAQSYITNKQKN